MLLLSKILPPLIFPIGLAILICLLAALFAGRARAWKATVLSLLAALLLYASASPYLSNRLIGRLERRNAPLEEYPRAQAIVLLGGAAVPVVAPRIHPETNWAGDRVLQAARLWRQGRAPYLVVTGGHIPFLADSPQTEAEVYASLLSELLDVPASSILQVPGTQNTHDDAVQTAELFHDRDMPREILLVTSASHMVRAAALFRKQGFVVHPAPTDFHSVTGRRFRAFDLLPSEAAMMETGIALREYLGLATYKALGRL